jgi:glycosyltransferase involved in cell wall biosynthesis
LPRRLAVLFVSSTLSGGGAERFVATVLAGLDRERFQPSLCLFRREIVYGLPADVPLFVLEKHRPWQIPRATLGLARRIDALDPDVVLSAFAHPNFVTGNALLLARRRPGWIARVSGHPDHDEAGWVRHWMRPLYARADLVLANAAALADAYRRLHPRAAARVAHQPNPVDFARIDALARTPEPPPPAGRARLVSLGRLCAAKRFDLQLEALARLRETRDAELVVCGEGPLRVQLERRAQALGLAERVRFLGFCENPFAWLASADVYLHSSDYEGLPNALIEAQGLGLPAVASDCAFGPAEIVEHGHTGRLVPPGDAEALARALAELLGDAERRAAMGRAARERARVRFDAPALIARLQGHLEAVAALHGR